MLARSGNGQGKANQMNLGDIAARAVAPFLGGHAVASEAEGESWRGFVMLADGIRLVFCAGWKVDGKGEILAFLRHPSIPGESRSLGKIGADLRRAPEKLAADIERRLLPGAREKAAAARKQWAADSFAAENLAALAARFSALPGVRTTIEKPGSKDQRLQIRYHESEVGSLDAEIYGGGNLYLNRVSVYGSDPGKLEKLIAAIRG
jgi:hypothetical protein